MIPPFNDHPLIRQYNEIKKYFRQHENDVSRRRIRQFRGYARMVGVGQTNIAFDITGSLNFGISTDRSDVDLVLYLECPQHAGGDCERDTCSLYRETERIIVEDLAGDKHSERYDVQIIDCINLCTLEQELLAPTEDCTALVRFAFYRSVCRAVNARLLRPLVQKVRSDPELVARLKPELFAIFDELSRSMQHQLSMAKYRERLLESGIPVPPEIQSRIREHLQQYEQQQS